MSIARVAFRSASSLSGSCPFRLPRPFPRALTWLFGIALTLSPWLAEALEKPTSVAFWYAEQPPLSELSQFDWVVLESAQVSAPDIAFLREQGSTPFAYLSIGEFKGDGPALRQEGLDKAGSPVRNEAWDSQVMDLASPVWRSYLLQRAARLGEQGYGGLFLDTLDSYQLLPESEREVQRQALVSLLRDLKRQQPGMKLFFNRGFEVLPELPGVAAAVAVESIHAGWSAEGQAYREVPQSDRDWLEARLGPLRKQGIPLVAIDYLPPERRDEARRLAARLQAEGYIPFVTTPKLDYLGIGSIEVQPRRIAMIYDPTEGDVSRNLGHIKLASLLEYLGYRVDYLAADQSLPQRPARGLYAGMVTWMTSGPPLDGQLFSDWLSARLDEQVPLAILAGLPVENDLLLQRLGLQHAPGPLQGTPKLLVQDGGLLGRFEAPVQLRARDVPPFTVTEHGPRPVLAMADAQGQSYTPVALADWGGMALSPFVLDQSSEQTRWILDPFAFLQRALHLAPLPRPDVTTENGRRIATVHIDGDGFVSRAEVTGTPYAGQMVLDEFIRPYPLLTSVSVIEGETGPKGMYPHLTREVEPIARKIFAEEKVEVASHTFSHPFYWQPEVVKKREDFNPEYGFKMPIPGYDQIDFTREIVGSRDYINSRLTGPDKPVKMLFWSGDALPDAQTIELAYASHLLNVNGGNTVLTRAYPSLSGLYPLIRPTSGGIQYYAPIANENVYTNLWKGPYYGFRGLIETFDLTENPRRLRGLHLYYHFYSGTKQASIKTMHRIYRTMLAQQPLSLWMSDYIPRLHGLYQASLARRSDGSWQVRGMDELRTLRLDPELGWPDLLRSRGVAGVRDLPQGRYLHLSRANATLVLRDSRDPHPALEEANIPLRDWSYLDENRVRFSFAGAFPLAFSVRASGACRVISDGRTYQGRAQQGLWQFQLPLKQVQDAQLVCQ
ncbi:bifunctional glycoside hydrolase 114/ polysaccharide deacetylase family protein [Azotobacter bryophylli]|uniref:Bifunctional glycoside hydrolase 114/ polysaccharide deacetylase family protein n=1 Tax=Azotobacter bryophylli TaxID=1986537 RepID=A0ABV7APB1_9GAMM